MGDFAKRTPRVKPKTMNCPMTEKNFRRRDGSEGIAYKFSFKDGSKTYSIQVIPGRDGKVTRNGKEIIGWAQVAQFSTTGGGEW